MRLSLARIEEAASTVDPVFLRSPQYRWDWFSAHYGVDLYLKVETLNPIRSFKGRGTSFFLSRRHKETPRLVTASAGNFGQGLAYAARRYGVAVDIFAAETASPVKLEAMRRFGATLHLQGEDFDGAKAAGKEWAAEQGLFFAEDGQEVEFAEGAGTIAIELEHLDLDILVVPLGNGALFSGIGCWMKAHSPRTRIVGVCAAAAPSMEQSWRRGGTVVRTATANTIADGIGVREPIADAVADVQECMDDCLIIGDRRIREAMRFLLHQSGLVVEASGAIGVAAATLMAKEWRNLRVATILCGGNLTSEQIQKIA
jgi:threonine dehydratase